MKKMLMLGTSYGSIEMIRYAKAKGAYTIVTDYLKPEKSIAKFEADEYWMTNTADLDQLEEKCRKEQINAIICGISEFNLEMCMKLCNRLGLPCYCNEEAWSYSRDKEKFKTLCKKLGVPVAADYFLSNALTQKELENVVYPVVVKPVDMSGNRGISFCNHAEELVKAYHHAKAVSKSDKIIVERMLHGKEWYAYYAMAEGKISLVALNAMHSQPGEPRNCYSITTTVSDNVERYVKEVNPSVVKLLEKVGCREGVGWVQFMLDEDGSFYILEMGYRLDGDMMFIPHREVCGFDSVAWLVDYAFGEKNDPKDLPQNQLHAFVKCGVGYMLWTNKQGTIADIQGFDEVANWPEVQLVESLAQVGDTITLHRSLGNIMFTTDNCNEMCSLIEKINRTVRILNTAGEDVIIHYDNFAYLTEIYQKGLRERDEF